MRRPGQGDTLIKIASLGGGAIGIGASMQSESDRHKRIKKELEKAKAGDAAYANKIAALKARQEHDKELRKKAAIKKLKAKGN